MMVNIWKYNSIISTVIEFLGKNIRFVKIRKAHSESDRSYQVKCRWPKGKNLVLRQKYKYKGRKPTSMEFQSKK